ncbi:MAG: tol-pal system protein YbgF, partial [Deltaproteobacteria bacterium RBG_16_55_12]
QLELIEREQRRLRTENVTTHSEFESTRSSLADTRANLQEMQRDLDALKEKMEEVRYQLDRQIGQSPRAGDKRIKDLEGRIARLDDDLKNQGALLKTREEELKIIRETLKIAPGSKEEAASVEGAGPSEFARERLAGESEAVKKDYDEAWKLLERKDYRAAISRFKEFIKKNPQSEYADNAQYWIGESHYALREFDQAILEFDAVRRKYPKGDKVPAALLKQGFAFAELGDKVDARLILQELTDRFPQSQEAVKAKQKLKSLES